MKKLIVIIALTALLVPEIGYCAGQTVKRRKNSELYTTDTGFLCSAEGKRIGDQLLMFQRVTGGWPKNVDICSVFTSAQLDSIRSEQTRTDDSTTDNNATTRQMIYLARLYKATGDTKYRDSFRRGLEYLLAGQYKSGGWPQFWPEPQGYQIHVTYNDNAMVNTLTVIRDLMNAADPYDTPGLMPEGMKERLEDSFRRGIECILATQIVTDGRPTVWCQQHDRETYAPAPARSYELPSYCSAESAGIVALLMELPEPDSRVRRAIHSAMRWFDDHKITGYRLTHTDASGNHNATLVKDPDASPLWARFYDLESATPFVCDRDGKPKRSLEEIGHERRNGYSWYNQNPADLYGRYAAWCRKWDRENMEKISL